MRKNLGQPNTQGTQPDGLPLSLHLRLSRVQKGVLLLVVAGFFFSLMGVFVKLAGDLPSVQKMFFRNLIATFIALILVLQSRDNWKVGKGNALPLLIRSLAGTLGVVCNFYAIEHLQIADAIALNKISPFTTLLFSYLLLKEKLKSWQFLLIAGTFAACLFVIKPSFHNSELVPALVGVLGGVCAGLSYTMVRKAQQGGVKGPLIVFCFSLTSILLISPFVWEEFVPMTSWQWVFLLAVGLSAAAGQLSLTAAYRHAPAREISIYDYGQIVYSMVLGLLFFGDFPDIWSLLGYALIIGFAICNYVLNQREQTSGSAVSKERADAPKGRTEGEGK